MNNQRFISFILIIAHFNQIIVFGAVGIIPDGSTRTFVTQTEQGVDLVNIARANESGLSRNNYDDFNVSERGVIFNNNAGHDPVSSSRGEAIRENIMLQGEAAQVILNQVTSVRKSELLGDMEVVGARADVIIANPNGIRVQGSRFINVDQGILTTGRPMFSDDGAIQGFDINGGTIEFGDQGLNASETDELLLITNQLQIKGAIHAKKIKAFTGNNTVQRNAVGEMEATNETNPNPHDGIGIDIEALGGMYAGKIYLVANEYGIGINNAGEIGAQEAELEIQTQGDLLNSGTISSIGKLDAEVDGDLINRGIVSAKKDLTTTAQGAIDNYGYLGTQSTLNLTADLLKNRFVAASPAMNSTTV